MEGVNNNITSSSQVVQGYSTFQLKYSASPTGPWNNLGDPVNFQNKYDGNNQLIEEANALRYKTYDISSLQRGTWYFAFTTTSTFGLIENQISYRSFVIIDNIMIGEDPTGLEIPEFYELTIPLPAGNYQYKYFLVADKSTWELGDWAGEPNRSININGATVAEDQWSKRPGAGKSQLFSTEQGVFNTTFRVNMAGAKAGDLIFNPYIHKVFVSGNFGGDINWIQPGANPNLELTLWGGILDAGRQNNIPKSKTPIIFPNPASTLATISSDVNIGMIEVFNLAGAKIHEQIINQPSFTLSTASYPNGLYLLKVYSGSGVTVHKLQVINR